ncbi:ABC transporter ATP-binding protein [Pilosibacter fragilis]|uniref:ABC transporter ATP-binding protein n=1 Tax=Pilosibacter fragilis TaxID=3078042 RepID=UPI0032D263FD
MNECLNLLEIKDLTVHYVTVDGTVHAVENLNLTLPEGKTLGLVGETGAGKTTTVKAIMQILPDPPAKILSGEVFFNGEDILKKNKKAMRKIRGKQISMIFQDPMTSLNPVITVGEQIMEVIRLHDKKLSKKDAYTKACEMLELVGIKADRAGDYPHQFSGGMKQRVIIAMALACNPKLLIADEPTTALDVTIQAQVLELMRKLKAQYQTSMIMITHDLGIVAEICDYVAVMYAGEIVEYGNREQLFHRPSHPYTKGLFACIPNLMEEETALIPIEGMTPDPTNLPSGCRFHPRCPYAVDECSKTNPDSREIEKGHYVKCLIKEE